MDQAAEMVHDFQSQLQHTEEQEEVRVAYMRVIHELVAWTKERATDLDLKKRKNPKATRQARVTCYCLRAPFTTAPFWDAYAYKVPLLYLLADPQQSVGGDGYPPELRQKARRGLAAIDRDVPLDDDKQPTIQIAAIGQASKRDQVKALMAELLDDLKQLT